MPRPIRVRLRPEALESRETPAAGTIESFDAIAPPGLPGGWQERSNDGTNIFDTKAGAGLGGTAGVAATGSSRTSGFAWNGTAVSGDTGAAASVKLDSLVPISVIIRGSNLNSATPSYVAATI